MKEFSQAARKLCLQAAEQWPPFDIVAEAMALGARAALNISQYAENPQLTDLQAVKVAAEIMRLLEGKQ